MVVRDDYEAVRGTFPPDVLLSNDPEMREYRDRMHGLEDRLVDPHHRLECQPCRIWLARERRADLRQLEE